MNNIQLLDCTLRDGGRVIDCAFRNEQIRGLIERLAEAKIDIIEMGFLRNHITYNGNSTFFRTIEQAEELLPKGAEQNFTLFIDYGMYDINELPDCSGEFSWGIRFGFTKKNFEEVRDDLKAEMLLIKKKGYRLYFQGVNTVGYSDKDLLDLIALANEVVPYSFGIVDTYGAMYQTDLDRLFTLVDFNLIDSIGIDFHGHNNIQMAFSLAQHAIRLCTGRRKLIIDATLDGMGKCAGNLNTELIVNYLNQKEGSDYEFDCLLDAIDEYVVVHKQQENWGYSIPAFMAGIYKSHPNNVIYLTDKFRISTKDIRKMLALIDEERRQSYDYDNIQRIYKDYFSAPMDDSGAIELLSSVMRGKHVLVLAPGISFIEHRLIIDEYISRWNPIIISVNFIEMLADYAFFGNDRRYQDPNLDLRDQSIIVTSNVSRRTNNETVVSYMSCIAASGNYFDNSSLMLLNLLQRLETARIGIAGVDGFSSDGSNYFTETDLDKKCAGQFETINRELEGHLKRFAERNSEKTIIEFVTPSRFEHVLSNIR